MIMNEEIRENGEMELTLFQQDILALTDLVGGFSMKEELATRESLKRAFAEWAASTPAGAEAAPAGDGVESAEPEGKSDALSPEMFENLPPGVAPDPPVFDIREQRRLVSRRELLTALLGGHGRAEKSESPEEETAAPALEAEEGAGAPLREISDEYFGQVLEAALALEDMARFTGWNGEEYYHLKSLLSSTYAAILSGNGNPALQMAETVRANSRDYPRPIALDMFEYPPFNFSPETVEECLRALASGPATADIVFTQSSVGTVYLYSSTYLEPGYAAFLAETADLGAITSP